ncbi:putative general secretion pathway protein [Sinorhizobium fredii NGR234]|uniref:General secretion pathway protein n=1 Tax=Sinorhizobium fredii (strain NBRC 101917 / NGR234) TaxID=394 RepID=C3MFK8_SINFN|nr:type II secretion system protein GspM [Sinorhizobium fredii]ACP26065.1 putative general secretion pathway protein [Sinorhizobium fredii NGR234]
MMLRLVNAPPRVQRAIALCMLVFCAVVMALTFAVGLSSIGESLSEIEDKRRLLGRLQAIRSAATVFLKANPMPATDGHQLFLEGENEAVITAGLQGWLQEQAVTAGAQINSVSNVRMDGDNGIALLGLRVNVSGSMNTIHAVVAAIELSQPSLFIREMDIQSNYQEAYGLDTPPELSATILMLGATDGKPQAAGADK